MHIDTSGYDSAQPIQIPALTNGLWGLLKTAQGVSVIIAAGAIMGLGITLWLSGDNTGRKTWIIGGIISIVIGEILIWGAPAIAVALAHFSGAL